MSDNVGEDVALNVMLARCDDETSI
jgi:hypothetical protein